MQHLCEVIRHNKTGPTVVYETIPIASYRCIALLVYQSHLAPQDSFHHQSWLPRYFFHSDVRAGSCIWESTFLVIAVRHRQPQLDN